MSKVIIVRCVLCLKPYNINYAHMIGNMPQCPHCKCYGVSFDEVMTLQPEIEEKLKEIK